MGIKHIKLEEIDSTQSWVKENISNHLGEDLLVSARHQTDGLGRMGNKWSQFGNSVAFSFSIKPNAILTMTPLEIGVLVVNFFKKYGFELKLKWPNDILIEEEGVLKKVGGILCHFYDPKKLIVGIGLNLDTDSLPEKSKFKFLPGAISTAFTQSELFYHEVPYLFYDYILANRLSELEIKNRWCEYSCHLNCKVKIVDDSNETEGTFSGLGENGEALISNKLEVKKVLSGSLWILD